MFGLIIFFMLDCQIFFLTAPYAQKSSIALALALNSNFPAVPEDQLVSMEAKII